MSQIKSQVQLDPITIATTWHFLQRICHEMYDTIQRTATNVLATTLHDLAYGVWDAEGRVIAIPEGIANRLIASSFPIKAVIKQFRGQISPGDAFLTNHPFKAGACHLPDWVFIRPIFYKGELVFFTCMGTHVPDNGGAQPGSYFMAYDSIAEGLNIPPVKLMEKGKMREDVFELILSNNRLPDMMRRETYSLIGSTVVAERRLIELLDKYGKDKVLASLDEMMDRTEKAIRHEISKWREGIYYAEAKIDDDGAVFGSPVTVRCKLTVKKDEAVFDFSESDEQRSGFVNVTYSTLLSSTLCTCFMLLDTSLADYHNEGSLRPIKVIAREGSVVNARPGALTAAASLTATIIGECVFGVLSQALPERAITSYARPHHLMFIGKDPRANDQMYVYTSFCPGGGAGAVYGYDGYQCCSDLAALGVVSKSDAEEEMQRFPWRVKKYEYLADSAGAGKWRGAPGIWWEGLNEGPDCIFNTGPCDGWYTQGSGQQGGFPTALNRAYIQRKSDKIPILSHRIYEIKAGDIIVCNSGGGAGVGFPEERDPEAVRMDVKNEIVSLKSAREIYKVILDPGTLEIDWKATGEARK